MQQYNMSIKELLNNKKSFKMTLNSDESLINRKKVWNSYQKSLYLKSIIEEFLPIPIIVNKSNDFFYIIDGKQRLSTIIDFIEDEFSILENFDNILGCDFSLYNYSKLPLTVKNKILNYKLSFYEYQLDNEKVLDLFLMYNNETPLKAIEILKVKLNKYDWIFKNISNHRLFSIINLNGKNRFQDYELSLYLLMLEYNINSGITLKEKDDFVNKLSKQDDLTIKNNLKKVVKKLDFIYETFNRIEYKECRDKYLKKSTIISLYILLEDVYKNDLDSDNLFKFMHDFFYLNKDKNNGYFVEVSRGSTTVRTCINTRNKYLFEAFDTYCKSLNKNKNKIIYLIK